MIHVRVCPSDAGSINNRHCLHPSLCLYFSSLWRIGVTMPGITHKMARVSVPLLGPHARSTGTHM